MDGYQFTVITDHYSLLWLHNLKDPSGRLARWALRLQSYSFKLVHRKGKEHIVPDLLSRSIQEDVEEVKLSAVTHGEKEDKWFKRMLEDVQENCTRYPSWKGVDGTLWKHIPSDCPLEEDELEWKQVVPKHSRSIILRQLHDDCTSGHLGGHKTYMRV